MNTESMWAVSAPSTSELRFTSIHSGSDWKAFHRSVATGREGYRST